MMINTGLVYVVFFFLSPVYVLPHSRLNTIVEHFIPCEEGWYFFGEKCYKIGGYRDNDRVTWEVAKSLCSETGGNLASIHSKEQNDFFTVFIALNMEQTAWIGLNDRENESLFIWEDGAPVNYLNWDIKQPDNYFEEDCVEFISESSYHATGKWNDRPCDDNRGYICRKDSNKDLKTPDPRFCSDDEGGGWKFRDSCFTLVSERKSWEDAEEYCQNTLNGHLMMILHEEHDTFLEYVLQKTQSPLWIGLKTQDRFQQMWTTGWPVSYNHFDNPLEEMKTGSCILRRNKNIWTTASCDKEYEFVCQTVDPPPIKKPNKMSKCPEVPNDWRDFGGEFCYFIDTKLSATWYKRQEICRGRGGDLATIHSQEEEKVLHSFLRALSTHVAIGLNSLLSNGEIYAWSDGSELNYTHWAPSEPNSKHEMCVQIQTFDMTWNDISCNNYENFLCQVKKEEVTKETQNVGDEALKEKECYTRIESTSPAVYICILLSGVVFILLAYISRKWIKSKIDVLNTKFSRSSSVSAERNRWSDENILNRD